MNRTRAGTVKSSALKGLGDGRNYAVLCRETSMGRVIVRSGFSRIVSKLKKNPFGVELIGFVGAAETGCSYRQRCTLGRTDSQSCTRLRCCEPRRHRGCF